MFEKIYLHYENILRKIIRFTRFVKILRNDKKYFEENFGNLEKIIEE